MTRLRSFCLGLFVALSVTLIAQQNLAVLQPAQIIPASAVNGAGALVGGTANSFVYSGASAVLTTPATPTNGQLLIGSTGAAPVVAALTGTANQVTVTNAAGAITLALPQSIGTGSTPQFSAIGVGVGAGAAGTLTMTGNFETTAVGVVGTPAIQIGDATTGFYTNGSQAIQITENGSLRYIFGTAAGSNGFLPGADASETLGSGTNRWNALNVATTFNMGAANILAISGTGATRSSGFGTAQTVTAGNSLALRVHITTASGQTTGVLTLPTAATGWACNLQDVTTTTDLTRQSAYTTASASFTTTVGWSDGDDLVGICAPF